MRIGAKIMLNTGMGAALDALDGLAGSGWMMSLPQWQEAYHGHPAGRARPGFPVGGRQVLVAVTFGKSVGVAGAGTVLPVQWESVEPGDGFTVLLDGDITLAPAAERTHSALTLAGFCRLPESTLTADGYDQARAQVIEAVREFIASVAVTLAGPAEPGQEPGGQAWSWVNQDINPRPPQSLGGPDST